MKPLRIGYLNYECVVMQSKIPVMLAFGAIWDAKSRRLFETLEYYANKYDKKLLVGMVEYEYASDLFTLNEIVELPTVIIYEDGKPFRRVEGDSSRDVVEGLIRYFFGFYN